jgi:hypothetical protein
MPMKWEMAMDKYGLEQGAPELKSTGAVTFGPDGILFVADNVSATIFAIKVPDDGTVSSGTVEVAKLDSQLASWLGVGRDEVVIRGMAVHPVSHTVYLSVMRGHGNSALPVLVRVVDGMLRDVPLEDVHFAQVSLADAPTVEDERTDVSLDRTHEGGEDKEYNGIALNIAQIKLRASTITDLAWIDGTLLVAGASNEEFASTLRRIPFPFSDDIEANSLEIFHVSHGKYETASPIRTFIPFDGNTSVLASYTCTPVVHFPLADLYGGGHAKGRTVAELGSMNQPLDMIAYEHDGAEYLLVSNTRHPLIKIASATIATQPGLVETTAPIGVPRQELDHEGATLMANLDRGNVVMMQRDGVGDLHLHTYSTASL